MSNYDDTDRPNGSNGPDELDREIADFYRPIADAPVPVRLHGRIVSTMESRGRRRRFGSGLGLRAATRPGARSRFGLLRLAPAGLVVAVAATVALAAMPLLLRGPAAPASGGSASVRPGSTFTNSPTIGPALTPVPTVVPSRTPFPSGASLITVINLGSPLIKVSVGGNVVGTLSCGQTDTYANATSIDHFDVQTYESWGTSSLGATGPHSWVLYLPGSFANYDTEPTGPAYSLCPVTSVIPASDGMGPAELTEPVLAGSPFDLQLNASIDAWERKWLQPRRDDLALAVGSGTQTIASGFTVDWPAARPGATPFGRWLPITLSFYRMLPNGGLTSQFNWSGTLVFDLTDGHLVTMSELFKPSSEWLAKLSVEVRAAGGTSGDATAPVESNFENWRPTTDGLQIRVTVDRMTESSEQPTVTIPWSVLKPILLPGSPIFDYIPS